MNKLDSILCTTENFVCPECGENFGEKHLEELCQEPFTGIMVECDCGAEFDVTMQISLTKM